MQGRQNGSYGAQVRLGSRHRPSGLNSRFSGGGLAFADYISHTREMLAAARPDRDTAEFQKIVEGNSPFELKPSGAYLRGKNKPYGRGVLLIHGLTDSPYFMRYLAEFFRESGFRVMAILLPGHGTQPGDLLRVQWQEWAKAVAYGTDQLACEADDVYLAGFSAGAALSIYHSLADSRVRGLFLFSPAIKITSRAAGANLHRLYSWLIPTAKWVAIMPDRSPYKYESFPKTAAAQMYALTKALAARLRKGEVTIPVFAAASTDDATVNARATLEFMAQARHSANQLVLYTTDTRKLPENIPPGNLEMVNSVVPEQRILSSAHTAIVLPPDDPHYGAKGDYSNFIHYYPGDLDKYNALSNGTALVLQGEITEANLKAGVLRRLMYNPNFAALKISMRRFIDGLP